MSDKPIEMGSDQPGNTPGALAVAEKNEVVEPIIVENTLWTSANPNAYDGGRPAQITHLRAEEKADKGDTGRWRALRQRPAARLRTADSTGGIAPAR